LTAGCLSEGEERAGMSSRRQAFFFVSVSFVATKEMKDK
jgi:hypothetical protein